MFYCTNQYKYFDSWFSMNVSDVFTMAARTSWWRDKCRGICI